MTDQQAAAFVFAQAVCAQAAIEGMKADNQQRLNDGHAVAYREDAFLAVIDSYGISHNAVMSTFANAYRSA
jgi:hypothetical protein